MRLHKLSLFGAVVGALILTAAFAPNAKATRELAETIAAGLRKRQMTAAGHRAYPVGLALGSASLLLGMLTGSTKE